MNGVVVTFPGKFGEALICPIESSRLSHGASVRLRTIAFSQRAHTRVRLIRVACVKLIDVHAKHRFTEPALCAILRKASFLYRRFFNARISTGESMSQHFAAIQWHRVPHPSEASTYSRNHVAALNGQQSLNVSASTEFKGDAACADPEQLLVTALASCHMLTFLAVAERQGYKVEQYEDHAVGFLEKDETGALAVTRIDLRPKVSFGGDKIPDAAALDRLHAGAHKNCFIGNSIKTKVNLVTGDNS